MNIFSRISPNARTPLGCLLILLGIFYAYAQVGSHRFVEFDDSLYAFDNRRLISGFNWNNLVWAFTNVDAVNWHPLTWLSLFMDRELFHERAGGYLLMNVFWHSIAACLCYAAFRKTTASHFIGLTVALIFALHPANVENVAWLSSRKSILDAAFWFLGIWFYINFLETKKRTYYLLVIITHILGLMCKSMHVTFPCTLWLVHLLYNFSLDKQNLTPRIAWASLKPALFYSAPMLLLSVYFSLVTLMAQTPAMSSLDAMSGSQRLINSTLSYERYLWMFFNPTEFAPFYPLFIEKISASSLPIPIAILALVTAACLVVVRRHPNFLLGWLWYLGTMIPVIGLVQVGTQSHADRYLYIPGIGLAIMLVSLFNLIPKWNTRQKWFAPTWLLGVAVSLAVATKIQAAYWKDGVTLFRHSLSVTGDCMTSVTALSASYGRQLRFDEGMAFLESKIAVAKNPLNIARLNVQLSALALASDQPDRALEALEKALDLGYRNQRTYYMATMAALASNRLDTARKYQQLAVDSPQLGDINFSMDALALHISVKHLQTIIDAHQESLKESSQEKSDDRQGAITDQEK